MAQTQTAIMSACLFSIGMLFVYLGLIKANSVAQGVVIALVGAAAIGFATLLALSILAASSPVAARGVV